MLRDARYSIRLLLRNPLVASVAVLSLALGIGGAASVFTVLNAVVLRDLPVASPQQLYAAEKHRANDVSTRYSWPLLNFRPDFALRNICAESAANFDPCLSALSAAEVICG